MRDYSHNFDRDWMARRLDRWLNAPRGGRRVVLARVRAREVDVAYMNSSAYFGFGVALCTAWGLEAVDTIAMLRADISEINRHLVEDFTLTEILERCGFNTLIGAALGADRCGIERLAQLLQGRPHADPDGWTSGPGLHHQTDALVALVTGNDPAAAAAAESAVAAWEAGEPTERREAEGWANAAQTSRLIGVVARRDAGVLEPQIETAIASHTHLHRATRARRASQRSLLHTSASVVAAEARRRGMRPPASPYIMPLW